MSDSKLKCFLDLHLFFKFYTDLNEKERDFSFMIPNIQHACRVLGLEYSDFMILANEEKELQKRIPQLVEKIIKDCTKK